MEILQFLLSFFIEEYGGEEMQPILEKLKCNSFNIIQTLKSINPTELILIVKTFMGKMQKNNCPVEPTGQFYGVSPINNIANSDILQTLNNYLGKPLKSY